MIGRRRRTGLEAAVAALLRVLVLFLPLAVVLWYFLIREEAPAPREAPGPAPVPSAEPSTSPAVPETVGIPRIPEIAPPTPVEVPSPPPGAERIPRIPEIPPPSPIEVPGPPRPGRAGIPRVGVEAFERSVADRLAAAAVRTSPLAGPVRFRAEEVIWEEPRGRPFFRADEISGLLDIGAAISGRDVVLPALTFRRPELVLTRDDAGRWNYAAALQPFLEPGPGPPGPGVPGEATRVIAEDVKIEGGRIAIHLPGELYAFRDLDAVLPKLVVADTAAPAPAVVIERLATTADIAGFERPVPVVITDGEFGVHDDVIEFRVDRVAVEGTIVTAAEGTYSPDAPGVGLDARFGVAGLDLARVAAFVPKVPPEGTAAFQAEVASTPEGRTSVRLSELAVTSGGSRIFGSVAVAFGGPGPLTLEAVDLRLDPLSIDLLERLTGLLPYDGFLSGRIQGDARALAFDVTGRLTTPGAGEAFDVGLVGRAELVEGAFAIRSLEAELRDVPIEALRVVAPGLPFRGRVSGRVAFRGPPGTVPVEVDVALTTAGGTITLVGTVDLRGEVPAYDLAGELSGIRLQALLEPEVPPATLTARYSLVGAGLDPATATARVRIDGGFTGWVARPGDSVRLAAAVDGGLLRVETAALSLGPLEAVASGTWSLDAAPAPGIEYRIEVRSLEPFGPYLPFPAGSTVRGAITTEGLLAGSLSMPTFDGVLDATGLEYGAWAARSLTADYEVALAEPTPAGSIALDAQGVETPTARDLERVTVSASLTPPEFVVDLRGDVVGGGSIELAATGRVEDGEGEALLRRLSFDLPDERWALARPARFEWSDTTGLAVQSFDLRQIGGAGRLIVDGRVPPAAGVDLRIDLAALPVGTLLSLLGREPILNGALWAELRATGTAEAPLVGGEFRIVGGALRDLGFTRAEGAVLYENGRVAAEATVVLDTVATGERTTPPAPAGTIQAEAAFPASLSLGFPPSFRLLEAGPLRATLRADSLSLAALSAVTPRVRDAKGIVHGRATIGGTLESPTLDGAFFVQGGAVTIPELDQRYTEITATLALRQDRVVIESFRARSDGWMEASGVIRFDGLRNPVVDLVARFDEFRAVGVEDYDDAALWGEARLAGPLAAPTLSGDLFVNDGNVVVARGDGGIDFEEDLNVDSDVVAIIDGEAGAEEEESALAPSWFDRLSIDGLIVEAGDNLWVIAGDARVQLQGELTIAKSGEDLRITGTLTGHRGTFTLVAGPIVRQFQIVDATIRFQGEPELNPTLDVTASRIIIGPNGEEIEVLVVVGGTLAAPTVALTTRDGTVVPESELLSLILFGRPSAALGVESFLGEGVVTGALFGVGGLAEVASLELEEALLTEAGLPLDVFEIRAVPGPYGGFGAPTVIIGSQIEEDVFLRVSAGLGTLFDSNGVAAPWTASLTWRIDPEWRLELAVEPVDRYRYLRGYGTALPVTSPRLQFIVELRRRWTY